jgi:hypothetical protein
MKVKKPLTQEELGLLVVSLRTVLQMKETKPNSDWNGALTSTSCGWIRNTEQAFETQYNKYTF